MLFMGIVCCGCHVLAVLASECRSRAASGSKFGREHRRQHQQGFPVASLTGDDRPTVPEDSLLRRDAEEPAIGGDGDGGERNLGTENRARAKSRRSKVRPSMGGAAGGGEGGEQEVRGGKIDWGSGSGEKPSRSSGSGGGSSKKERRPKSKARRGERGDLAAGRRADEVESSSYPSLLDSALWKGGGELDDGAARSAGGGSDLYDFGG